MLAQFNSIFSEVKDRSLCVAIQTAINHKIKDFGEILEFNLDSKNKTMTLEIMLDGEKDSLHVEINSYELMEEKGKHYLVVNDIVTSRIWINTISSQYLNKQKFEIPDEYAKMLKFIV